MTRHFALLLLLFVPVAKRCLIAESSHHDCVSPLTWITTSDGGYCGNTASESPQVPAGVERPTGGESQSPEKPSAAPHRQFTPAIPIAPLYPNGPLDLTADVRLDKRLASAAIRTVTRMGSGVASDSETSKLRDIGNDVFHRLIEAGFGQRYPWRLILIDCAARNAFSTPYGQVYVCRGLLSDIGDNPGLWAAVLSHEVAHSGLRHAVREYMFQQRMRRALGYSGARRFARGHDTNGQAGIWPGYSAASADAVKRLRSNLEIQADEAGMLIMARAGYHPDYSYAFHHVLDWELRRQSPPPALVSDQQPIERTYAGALAEFNKYWPHAAQSPGGLPPTVVFFGDIDTAKDRVGRLKTVSVPVLCRNSAKPIKLEASFQQAAGRAQNAGGASRKVSMTKKASCSGRADARQTKFRIPAELSAVGVDGELSGVVLAYTKKGRFLGASKEFEVRLPK